MSMPEHLDRMRMQHMLDHAREALEMVGSRVQDDVLANRLLQLALVQLAGVVGEAARRVSDQTQARYPEIPSRNTIATGDRLRRGLPIDGGLVRHTIIVDFPPLLASLERALSSEPAND